MTIIYLAETAPFNIFGLTCSWMKSKPPTLQIILTNTQLWLHGQTKTGYLNLPSRVSEGHGYEIAWARILKKI